jgi:putative addiction module component (TIGR02574 family)
MTSAAAKVLEQALALTPEERIEVARELEASVDPQAESPEWVAAWKVELERRQGTPTESWEDVRARLRTRWPAR